MKFANLWKPAALPLFLVLAACASTTELPTAELNSVPELERPTEEPAEETAIPAIPDDKAAAYMYDLSKIGRAHV